MEPESKDQNKHAFGHVTASRRNRQEKGQTVWSALFAAVRVVPSTERHPQVLGVAPELFFDAKQLVVLRNAVGAAR